MEYAKEILEELKKTNALLSKLLNKNTVQPPDDFQERVRQAKAHINNKLGKITNN